MKITHAFPWFGVALAVLLPAVAPALGPEAVEPSVIVVEPAPPWCQPLAVSVRADRTTYLEGDEVRLTIRVNEDAHVFVYSTDGDGFTRQLLPNAWDQDNFARAGQTRRLPSSAYRLRASSPGWDTIHVIAVAADRTWWTLPEPCLRYSDSDPFPSMPGGVDNARFEIQGHLKRSLEAEAARLHAARNTDREARVKPEPVPVRPRWGEATTRLYVRPIPVEETWVTPYYIIQDDWWTCYDPYRDFDRLRYDIRHQVDETRREHHDDPPPSISRPVDRRNQSSWRSSGDRYQNHRMETSRDRLDAYHDSVSDRSGDRASGLNGSVGRDRPGTDDQGGSRSTGRQSIGGSVRR